ncbi:MAG: DNA-3-methyladenine glycosylase [Bacillota bacterium]|nr:DNA-3-methyladenine glycosylase [Bacillota bacterium]MDK2926163.1 DNA-3-methyladenine glycosylase [Bacillota bacterium]MDK2960469.1 DNA-3-methyladenine glycosylase [Bacillota bacterium]
MEKLPRSFYARPATEVAPDLLGKLLVHVTPEGLTSGYIVETEAYMGPEDKAAHSYGGRPTERTRAMFGPPGHAYVYFIYGMYHCFNVVVAEEGQPQAVLIRALEPAEGIELMARRRGLAPEALAKLLANPAKLRTLTDGPGKLCQALGITRAQYGLDLTGDELFLTPGRSVDPKEILTTPRINVDYAGEWAKRPWRFVLAPRS